MWEGGPRPYGGDSVKVCVIANPVAGGGRGRGLAEELEVALQEKGIEAAIRFTEKAGDAERFAGEVEADCLGAVGGDGTLNEVVNGLGERQVPVAVLPAGSANVVARELKMPREPLAVAELIAAASVRAMDMGLHEGRRFVLGAGAGLDAAVAEVVKAGRGARSSVLRWVWPAVRTALRYPYPPIRVTVDGAVVSETAQYAIVGICRYSAGIFPATRRACIDDGLLDVCLLHRLHPLRLLPLAASVWMPSFPERADVVYVQGREVAFLPASDVRVPLQIDGDPAGSIPARFEVLTRALRIVTPTRGTG